MYYRSKAEVFFLEFTGILHPGFCGNPLQRIITEPSAVMSGRNYAKFFTDHRIVIQFPSVDAIGAVSLNFFAKQHENTPLFGAIVS